MKMTSRRMRMIVARSVREHSPLEAEVVLDVRFERKVFWKTGMQLDMLAESSD